jgi:hypothetical protein
MANKHRKVWKIVFWKLLFGNKYGLELNSIPKVPKNLRQITPLLVLCEVKQKDFYLD